LIRRNGGWSLSTIVSTTRSALTVLLLTASLFPAGAQQLGGSSTESQAALARGEWPAYAGTYASARYSPLDQINTSNAANLKVVWRWTSPDHAVRAKHNDIDPSWYHEATPIMVNGVLYTNTSLSQVAAIDAATGRTKWVFDPEAHRLGMPTNNGWLHRGVAYWRDGGDERIIMLTVHGSMIARDAKTGRPIESFGDKGVVDLVSSVD
jgi:quinoprotein glucose dehydrogenase